MGLAERRSCGACRPFPCIAQGCPRRHVPLLRIAQGCLFDFLIHAFVHSIKLAKIRALYRTGKGLEQPKCVVYVPATNPPLVADSVQLPDITFRHCPLHEHTHQMIGLALPRPVPLTGPPPPPPPRPHPQPFTQAHKYQFTHQPVKCAIY